MIKTIIFDFGGVLYSFKDEEVIREAAEVFEVDFSLLYQAWSRKIPEFEKGMIKENKFWFDISKIIGQKLDQKKLHSFIVNKFQPIQKNLDLVLDLKKKYQVGLLSNHTNWIYDLEKKFQFKKFFDPYIISWEARTRKPEPEIFQLLIKKTGKKPNEIIFIDNSIEYEPATQKCGINFIHYQSPKKLLEELDKYLK